LCRSGLEVAIDIAYGLAYLHGRRIIHLDLKSSNVLLRRAGRDSDPSPFGSSDSPPEPCGSGFAAPFQAKIGDVGLSKILPVSREYIACLEGGGTWNWCAPEVIISRRVTSAADMWSFGVILWELCTGEVPVRGRMRDVVVPDECPQPVADLMSRCWQVEPSERPTAQEALQTLKALVNY